jgi:hypothetical protein
MLKVYRNTNLDEGKNFCDITSIFLKILFIFESVGRQRGTVENI